MALPSTKDPKSLRVEASFDRPPPPELTETLPFSLLNELIGDLPNGVVYRPPELQSARLPGNVMDTSRAGERETVEKTKTDSQNGTSPKPKSEAAGKPMPEPIARKRPDHEMAFRSETVAANGLHSAAPPVPPNFPKFHAPVPSPGVSKPSPAKPPVESQEKPAAREDPARRPLFPKAPTDDQRRRPKRGFQTRPAKRALDPVDKAIRIFESLGKSPADDDPTDAAPAVSETGGKAPDARALTDSKKSSSEEKTAPASQPSSAPAVSSEAAPPVVSEAAPLAPPEVTPPVSPKSADLAPAKPVNLQAGPPSPESPVPAAKALEPPPSPFSLDEPAARSVPAFIPADHAGLADASAPAGPKPEEPIPEPVSATPSYRVVYRRRRRRPVPVNPWTAQGAIPGTQTTDRQEHIDASLAELAKILQASLDQPRAAASETMPPAAPKGRSQNAPEERSQNAPEERSQNAPEERSQNAPEEQSQNSNGPEAAPPPEPGVKETPPSRANPGEPVLRKSFSPGTSGMQSETKVKLVPRALSGEGEASTPTAAFEITAPTTLVDKDAPISPFTKIAQGQASSPHHSTPTPRPNPGGQSPFVPAGGLFTADLRDAPPSVAGKPATPFASPFATALEKRRQTSESGTETAGAPPPASSGMTRSPLRVTPIRPPEDKSQDCSPVDPGQLPSPAVSFASVLPSSSAGTSIPAPRSTPRGGGLGRNRGPVPRPSNSPVPRLIRPTSPADALYEGTRKKRRRFSAISQRRPWRILLGLFAIAGIVFLLIYLYAAYVTQSPERWPESNFLKEEPLSETPDAAPLDIDLSEPLEALSQFLAAESNEQRTRFVLEQTPDLAATMDLHYATFPLTSVTSRQIIDGGTFPDTGRDYVTALVEWDDGSSAEVHFIRDAQGDFRFSWYAFEQARNRLLRHYTATAWTGWTSFFVEIRPLDPRTLPEGIILENLYYRVRVPEDPEFEAIAYVDENSSLVPDFQERFANERSYRVVAEMQRGAKLLDDDRPVFRLTRLVKASWDPGQAVSP